MECLMLKTLVTDSAPDKSGQVVTSDEFEPATWDEIMRRMKRIRSGEAVLIPNDEVLEELRRDYPQLLKLVEAIDQCRSE